LRDTSLHVPARTIPVPASVSPEAQAILALGIIGSQTMYPSLDDPQSWHDLAAHEAAEALAMMPVPADPNQRPTPVDIGGVSVYVATAHELHVADRRIYLDVHGGAWFKGGGEFCGHVARGIAAAMGVTTWSVDYRMPPDHPFPAALEDCEIVYRRLLDERDAADIVLGGTSAGGNIAAALVLRLRDHGLPLPAAVVLNTPAVDLTMAGDTWQTNMGIDNVLAVSQMPAALLYANGHDLRDPELSPLFGNLADYPPTILLAGTRDPLLSDTVRFHRELLAANVRADLHVFEASGHIGFLGQAPEDADRSRQMRSFANEFWSETQTKRAISQ
jgi:monoterpene epsilon-lactone hydrolase